MSMTRTNRKPRSGLELLEAEMARQHADALASMRANAEMAARIAASIRRTGRLLMIGMGASHYANRIVEPLYRRLGIDAWATAPPPSSCTAPPPATPRTAIVRLAIRRIGRDRRAARSGWSDRARDRVRHDARCRRARSAARLPCLVGAGGAEVAFAATRSLIVTLALHAARCSRRSAAPTEARGRQPATARGTPLDDALATLAGKTAIVFAGRGVFRGVAEAASLMLMELARMPALGFEIGQFRHGPLELLSPELGVVLLLRRRSRRGGGRASLRAAATDAGSPPVDLRLQRRQAGSPAQSTIAFPPRRDLGGRLHRLACRCSA